MPYCGNLVNENELVGGGGSTVTVAVRLWLMIFESTFSILCNKYNQQENCSTKLIKKKKETEILFITSKTIVN